MSFIDKYYAIFNNSVGQHSVTISRAEFANLLGVFSKQEQQLNQLKEQLEAYKMEAEEGKEINAELKAEYEELKKIIDEAKNSKLDLKSFLVGEAVQNEYEQQLAQAIAQREAFWAMYRTKHGDLADKYEKLKAENEDLKKSILQECPNCGEEYLNYKGVELYYENNDLKQTLTEIKEIAENGKRFAERWMITGEQKANVLTYANAILQKISEVENGQKI